ncbi:MAG: ankyrin repeat domain-containing protein [Parachlamydiaceae bacterium]
MSIVPHDATSLEDSMHFYGSSDSRKRIKIDVRTRNIHGLTPLHLAVLNDRQKLAVSLINHGAEIEALSPRGRSSLHIAVADGNFSMGNLLIRMGANCGQTDPTGDSPLSIAISTKLAGYKEMMCLLKTKDLPAVAYAKELHRRKSIALTADVGGDTTFESNDLHGLIKAELEGEFGGYCSWRRIAKGILAFRTEFPDLISERTANLIIETVKLASKDEHKSIDQLYNRWKENLPIILNTGCKNHFTSILLWKNRLIHCNRAATGYSSDKFDRQYMSGDLIHEIINIENQEESEFDTFFSEELPQVLSFRKTVIDEFLENTYIPEQTIGNCTWANAEGIILPFLILCDIQQPIKGYEMGPRSLQAIRNRQSHVFDTWKAFVQMRILSKYIKRKIASASLGTQIQEGRLYAPDLELFTKALEAIALPPHADEKLCTQKQKIDALYHILYGLYARIG